MNEHQIDYISDLDQNKLPSEQNLSPEIATNYNQNLLTIPTHTEQSWEQYNQTDYTQADFKGTENHYSSGCNEMEIQSSFYGSDLSDFNNSYYGNQHLYSDYEQTNYSVEQNYYENTLETQHYNNNLWEQQFQQDSNSVYDDMSLNEQRSGHDPTAEDLQKANELDKQAREAEAHYKDYSNLAENLEKEHRSYAHNYYESAAEYKKKAEELRAEAAKLRGQT